jgi:hypothetical protein
MFIHMIMLIGSLDLRRRTFWPMNLIWWPWTLVMLIQTILLLCSRMTQMTSLAGAPILRWNCQPIRKMRWVYYGLGIWLLKIIRSPLRYELIDLWIVTMVGPNDNGMYINCDWLYQFEIYFTGLVIAFSKSGFWTLVFFLVYYRAWYHGNRLKYTPPTTHTTKQSNIWRNN